MYITPQEDDEAAQQAVAMQEIEVVSMDDGEDNVTLSSSTLPYPRTTTPSTLIESSPPPSLTCLSSTSSTTSALSNHSPAMPPQSTQQQEQQDESLDILLSMLSKEQTLPTIDYTTRITVKPTPISISASLSSTSSDNRSLSSNLLDSPNSSSTEEEEPINNQDRTKMCDWYYEMSDFLKITRATASRSLTILDRFMSTDVGRLSSGSSNEQQPYNVAGVVVAATQNRDEYQLVALTALFLSIKLYERLNIQPEHVSYLSRERYTSEEVIKMEIVMLQALEWRVCVADKIDYVESYLDVMLPSMKRLSSCLVEDDQDSSSSSSTDADNVLSSMKELATLQIQLSDFDPSFSTQRPSLVAFAAVINAFELKKDKLTEVDQSTFLTSVHVLMDKMYPLNDFLSKSRHTRERQELGSTVDRLRILVDPPSATVVGNMCGVMDTTTPVELTPTSYQQRYQDASSADSSSRSCNDDNSTSLHDRQVSPLDMALESMENFDMAQLLCCGMPHRHHASASSYQAAAVDAHAMYNNKNVMDMMDTDDEDDDDEEDDDPAAVMSAASHQHLLESATSFGSIPNADRQQHSIKVTNSVSPTSIATILFGGGAASSNKK